MTQEHGEVPVETHFEDILPRTGWGLYYRFMITMACALCFTQSMANFALPVAIELSTCDHSITRKMILSLHTSFILGKAFGGFFLNALSDIYGRKKLLTHTMLLIFISSFMAAFAYNYYVIIFAAFVLASGLEAFYCVIRVHLAEILPLHRRGFYLSLCDLSWSIGYIIMSILNVLLKEPSYEDTNAADMRLTYWRMIFAIAGGLNITMACATALLEESPRYFLHIKKYFLAILTLKLFYAINKSSYGEYLEVKEADVINLVNPDSPSIYPEPRGVIDLFKKNIKLIFHAVETMFSKKLLRTTIILILIKLPLLILGHLNVNILLAKYSYLPNSSVHDGVEVLHLNSLKNVTMCNTVEESETMYFVYFTLMVGIVLGIMTVTCFIDYFGRKILLFTTLIMCAACYIALFCIKNITGKIILCTVLIASLSAGISTVSVVNIESYPTALRCTSWGFINFPVLWTSHFLIRYYYLIADYFFIIHAVLFCGAAIAVFFLRDLKRKPMVE